MKRDMPDSNAPSFKCLSMKLEKQVIRCDSLDLLVLSPPALALSLKN